MKILRYILLIFGPWSAIGQNVILPIGDPHYDIIDRWDVLYPAQRSNNHISAIKNYSRKWIVSRAMKIDSAASLNLKELYSIKEILIQNDEWKMVNEPADVLKKGDSTALFQRGTSPIITSKQQIFSNIYTSRKPIFKWFYTSPAHLLQVDKPHFTLRINPILKLQYGFEKDNQNLFVNQRGISIRGGIDRKIYFHSRILETQSQVPQYVSDYINRNQSIPGNGLYKRYTSDIFKVDQGYDYLNADAFVGFNFTKHVGAQLGYGKHFLGNGIRSLLLSDFANNYFYLRLNTQVWKFHYQNIFGEINSESPNAVPGDQLVSKKYFAAHYLGFKIVENLDVGIFETVVFNRSQFELQYLNPVILYRSVEGNLGSPDNVLIGLDVKWNLWNTLSIYSQIMLDEFKLNELITNNEGWWANKYGIQLGLKYFDILGVPNLDGQVEFNQVRPYTYTHRDSLSNYSHGYQPLAHPLGANFNELLVRLRYKPINRLNIQVLIWVASKGLDDDKNWGGNILLPNRTRVMNFGNETTQGITTQFSRTSLSLDFEIAHRVYWDLNLSTRSDAGEQTFFMTTGLRMNIGRDNYLF